LENFVSELRMRFLTRQKNA